jgi:hypothetical protein
MPLKSILYTSVLLIRMTFSYLRSKKRGGNTFRKKKIKEAGERQGVRAAAAQWGKRFVSSWLIG